MTFLDIYEPPPGCCIEKLKILGSKTTIKDFNSSSEVDR